MKSYSQNREDILVLDYFKGFKGTLLEIGANDGRTLSNSLLLIENGWSAVLFEPGMSYIDLSTLHRTNRNVEVFNLGVGDKEEIVTFWESGAHVPNGSDKGLVSTADFEETKRWPDVTFTERQIYLVPFSTVAEYSPFHFISIDAEGYDWKILQQINLTDVGCLALCIEWNNIQAFKAQFTDYCGLYGLKLAHSNAENLIFCR